MRPLFLIAAAITFSACASLRPGEAACRKSAQAEAHRRVAEPPDSRCSGGGAQAEYVQQLAWEEERLFAECMGGAETAAKGRP